MGFFATSGILNERGFFAEGFDPDALNYINRVETADGERLEPRVRTAINQFVLGCKQDGVWTSLVTSCIMAGARTVAGAITPLVGNAPTNNNFVAGDYSRTLGLIGNDSNKYLNTGYNNNDTTNFPQNDCHISCYVSASNTDNNASTFVGNAIVLGGLMYIGYGSVNQTNFKIRNTTNSRSTSLTALGFQAISRNGVSSFISRQTSSGGAISDASGTTNSVTPTNGLYGVFAAGSGANPSNARMSFYSIGKSLSISNLDTRVTTLMTTLASVIT